MELNFEFATATKIIFGNGSSSKLSFLLQGIKGKFLVVTGRNGNRHEKVVESLHEEGYEVHTYKVDREPTIDMVSEGARIARSNNCAAVIGIGGGSVIDAAKAIAALASNRGELIDYLEVIGKGLKPEHDPLPYIAVPTTAGTGAEVTKNAVIFSPEHKVKVSVRSERMYPFAAVIDPELTLSMPPELTAFTGMDALTHLLETFVSNQSNPMIDMFCREGMKRISESLELAHEEGSNLRARENMSFAAMLGGMALANVKLGAVHGFAAPMGGLLPIPHGLVCAALLPPVMKVNFRRITVLELKPSIDRYNEVGRLLTGKPDANAHDGIEWVEHVLKKLRIPVLSSYGLTRDHFKELINKAKISSSMKGNPVVLRDEELLEILEEEVSREGNH